MRGKKQELELLGRQLMAKNTYKHEPAQSYIKS